MITELTLRMGLIYLACTPINTWWWAVLVVVLLGNAYQIVRWFDSTKNEHTP